MKHLKLCTDICVTTLIRICYGKFNSFRIFKIGMQEITETYQLVRHDILINKVAFL